jgi:hypothetical protein
MTYGHAERNLAFIRQLEAETRGLRVRSAVSRVAPSDKHLLGDNEVAPAFSQAVPAAHQLQHHCAALEKPSKPVDDAGGRVPNQSSAGPFYYPLAWWVQLCSNQ